MSKKKLFSSMTVLTLASSLSIAQASIISGAGEGYAWYKLASNWRMVLAGAVMVSLLRALGTVAKNLTGMPYIRRAVSALIWISVLFCGILIIENYKAQFVALFKIIGGLF